jgi:hypothetical protein
MAIEFLTGGGNEGGGGGGRKPFNRKAFLIGGVIVVLLIIVFRRSQPAAQTIDDTTLLPNTMDMPTYPNLDQQTLDNQFANYMAINDQNTTAKFMQVTDSLNSITTHMDTNNKTLLDAINAGLTKQITTPSPAAPVPITPVKTPAANPLHPVSAGIKYAVPRGGWNPNSVVDYLKSKGYKNSLSDRGTLAKQAGISGYKGTAAQNTLLLSKLKKI